MAKVYSIPEDYPEPPHLMGHLTDGRFDTEALEKAEEEWLRKLADWCHTNTRSTSDLVGEVIQIPWADGAAQYMVFDTKPLSLLHLPLGDAWSVPDYTTRGLRVKDVRDMIARDRKLAALFAERS